MSEYAVRIHSFALGHAIVWENGVCRYKDDGSVCVSSRDRPCIRCGLYATEDGHDPCIANLPGVKNACCGHGVQDGYIQFENGTLIDGPFRIRRGDDHE